MASPLAFVLTLVCLFQIFSCESVHDVVDEYRPTIKNLGTYVKTVSSEAAKNIGDAYSYIQAQAEDSKATIARKSVAMDEAIIRAKKDAVDSGKSILKCVLKANLVLAQLTGISVVTCTKEYDLTILKKDQLLINVIYGKVKLITPKCVALNPTASKVQQLRECYESNIQSLKNEAANSLSSIQERVGKVRKESVSCLNSLENEKEDVLQNGIKDLKKCVAAAIF